MNMPLNKKFKKPYVVAIHLNHDLDTDPDLTYLEQDYKDIKKELREKYKEQDQERLRDYNNGYWWMVSVYAQCDILIPFNGYENKYYCRIVPIKSSGAYGIESDCTDDDFKEIEQEQINELKETLKKLHVRIPKNIMVVQAK